MGLRPRARVELRYKLCWYSMVFEPCWSEDGSRFCSLLSEVGYGFQRNHDGVWRTATRDTPRSISTPPPPTPTPAPPTHTRASNLLMALSGFFTSSNNVPCDIIRLKISNPVERLVLLYGLYCPGGPFGSPLKCTTSPMGWDVALTIDILNPLRWRRNTDDCGVNFKQYQRLKM